MPSDDMSDFAAIHDELRSVARDLLGKLDPPDPVDWRLLAESAWLGLEVPAELDGAAATFAEVAVILEEMGRAATTSGYLGSVVLGVGALNAVEAGPGRDDLLRAVAEGRSRLAVALVDGELDAVHTDLPFRLDEDGGRRRLSGRAAFVPDAAHADQLLLLATGSDAVPVLVHLDAETASGGLTRTPQPVLDQTREFASLTADAVEVADSAIWRFATDADSAVRMLRDRAALAVAYDSLGLSEAMLDATVAYAKVRHQFGRPIGSFQAVKHACADMQVAITITRQLVGLATARLVGADAEASATVSMAKSHATAVAVDIAGKAMQLHGGIGYTWESGIHVYLKRASLNRALFGSPSAHRKHLARRYLD